MVKNTNTAFKSFFGVAKITLTLKICEDINCISIRYGQVEAKYLPKIMFTAQIMNKKFMIILVSIKIS